MSTFQHVSATKSSYKWLAGGIEFVDAIPKNPSGKILRRILRDKAKTLAKPIRAKM
jgi:4-coumarate--CoA ligase